MSRPCHIHVTAGCARGFMAVLDVVRHHGPVVDLRSSCGTRDYVVRWPEAVPLAMSTEHYARHITPLLG
jgi:hypothetical protein